MDAITETPPLAKVGGEPYTRLPQDLYIPPDALEVFLETFEGPLDLLLYLIKRQNLNILDIPIADITRQYMEYLALMRELRLELAAEYLVMAAWLAEIKSRLLLPKPAAAEAEEEDPRAELVRRLAGIRALSAGRSSVGGLAAPGARHFPRPRRTGRMPGRARAAAGRAWPICWRPCATCWPAPNCSAATTSGAKRCRCASG